MSTPRSTYPVIYLPHTPAPTYSKLFSPSTLGIGTPWVESFTSFLNRLSLSHNLYLHTLVRKEILQALSSSQTDYPPASPKSTSGKSWWGSLSVSLNSLNPLTEDWVYTLQKLTLIKDLRFLTMLAYKEVLPYKGLIRACKAWCAECYEEMRMDQQEVYDHLIWSLEANTICMKHKRILDTTCPFADCGKSLTTLSPRGQVGFCSYCNRWLGTTDRSASNMLSQATISKDTYIHDSVAELLSAAPSTAEHVKRENIAKAVRQCIQQQLDGNATELARLLDMRHSTIYDIRDGKQLPQLGAVLKLCALLQIRPVNLFTGTAQLSSLVPENVLSEKTSSRPAKQYRKFDLRIVKAKLEAYLNDSAAKHLSMSDVAAQLGFDQSFLYDHIPDLCIQISRRFKRHEAAKAALRVEQLCSRVREVTIRLRLDGMYPSYKRMKKEVGGILKDSAVRDAYYKTMQQLGFRNKPD